MNRLRFIRVLIGVRIINQRYQSHSISRQLFLTTFGVLLYGVGIGISMSIFNNYLNDTFHLGPDARGGLEFPRELPGFMTAATVGLLFFLSKQRKAVIATVLAAIGQVLMVTAGQQYLWMVLFMMVWSVGDHLYYPMKSALVLACSESHNRGKIMGRVGSFELSGIIVGALLAHVLAERNASYFTMFSVSAIANLIAGMVFFLLPRDRSAGSQPRLILKRKYTLYYILEILFGARKQIFLTFGPWVLIQIFDRHIETFAVLTIVGHLMAMVARPLVGWAIDTIGERKVIMIDGTMLIAVCLGYGFADRIPIAWLCLPVAIGCFLFDELLFFVGIARATYLSKIVDDHSELPACLAAGVSVNHIASMTLPFIAGTIWVLLGHSLLFVLAASVAVLIVIAGNRVPE